MIFETGGKMKRQILISSLILLFVSAFAIADDLPYKAEELIVRFADVQPGVQLPGGPRIIGPLRPIAIRDVISDFAVAGASVHKEYDHIAPGLTVVKLPEGVSVLNALVSFNQTADVLYAEPNYKLWLAVIPNDTRFGELWGMNNIGQSGGTPDADIDAPEAWNISAGSSNIVVAVTDTGVDYTHLDLTANMWVNPGEIPDNGIDDDGDGYVDDVYGCDTGDNDGNPMDDSAAAGHGTHIAGTIGAVGNNARGVAGVCWDVSIMAVKIADANGALWLDAAIEGIQYATSKGARVINASWGGYDYSQAEYDVIVAARNAGVIFVAAAGNGYPPNSGIPNNNDTRPYYPSSYYLNNIIAVMATTDTDGQAYYSNYGLASVDLGAPGGEMQDSGDPRGILSTLPGNQYDFYQGTSMAAPHVAGACSLLLSADPDMTYTDVKQFLLDYSDLISSLTGLCVSGGRLNLFNAVYEVIYDDIPPLPDPAEWEIEPQATGLHTIAMEAREATDRSGVEYSFECVTDANFNSGWQDGVLYERGDYAEGTTYTFKVKYRDKSENQNETDWSSEKSATTASGSDDKSPFPDPSRWKIKPKVIKLQPVPQVRMSAKTSTDEYGPVEYFFECTYINPPGPPLSNFDSGWISSSTYTISSGLTVDSTYTFTVRTRDAALPTETTGSIQASVTVGAPGTTNVLTVPVPYPTIQGAIDAAVNGDIVEVRPGTYRGTGNRNLDFSHNLPPSQTRAITVRSIDPNDSSVVAGTVIDIQRSGRAFDFHTAEGPNSIVTGFTIINGYISSTAANGALNGPDRNGVDGVDLGGGAINCNGGSSPTIRDCVITNCWVFGEYGGYGARGDPNDPNGTVPGGNGGNGGRGMGGAIYVDPISVPTIYNCKISGCHAIGGDGGAGGDGEDTENPGGIGGFGGAGNDGIGGGICDAGSNAIISNCTISDCFANLGVGGADGNPYTLPPRYPPKGPDGHGFGGGMYYSYGYDANAVDTKIIGNGADNDGGGIYCYLTSPTTKHTLINCDILNNFCIRGNGGGIWYDNSGTLTLNNCDVSNNTAPAGYNGGGIYAGDINVPPGATVIIDSNSTISSNTAGYNGGGLFLIWGNLTVSDSIIRDNNAYEGAGVWIYNCTANVNDCTVRDNSATYLGGGFSFINSQATINNCIMTGNSASSSFGGTGGALYFEGWLNNNPHWVTNCLITDNLAYSDGGGLSNSIGAWTQITNCTFSGNKAIGSVGVGGGISCSEFWAYVEIFSSILWGNEATDGGSQIAVGDPYGSIPCGDGPYANVDVNSSDVQGGEDGVWLEDETQEFTALWWLDGSIDEDPLFAPIRATEQTYFLSQVASEQLEPNSPCVDTGYGNASDLELIIGMPLTTRTDYVADSGTVDMGYHYEAGLVVSQYQLTIEVIDQGYGTFGTILPPWEPGTYTVNQGRVVPLHAEPNDGWEVYQWTGTDYVPVNPAEPNYNTVTMDSDKTVTVEFGPSGTYKLVTHVIGNGTIEPSGLTVWSPGTEVSLTATPDNPSEAIKWIGTNDDISKSRYNTVTMNTHKEVFVEFYEPRTLDVPGDYTNIQVAINEANDGDIVLIAPGIYDIEESSLPYEDPFIYISGKAITITSTAPDEPCTVAATVIYGAKFVIEDVNRGTVINGLTIQEARYGFRIFITSTESGADGPGGHVGDRFGGGMQLLGDASPDVRNCRFVDCAVGGIHGGNGNSGEDVFGQTGQGGWPGAAYGGAVSVGENGNPIFTNCTFIDCFARGGDGGNGADGSLTYWPGHGGGWGDPEAPWWEWGPFEDYWKYTGFGGAAYCAANSSPEFVDCNFANNHAYGGSCGISGLWPGSIPQDGWPYRHYKIDSFGGAVYAALGSAPRFTGCSFIGNEADVNGPATHVDGEAAVNDDPYISYGGAIAWEDGTTIAFDKCTFNDNLATIGGGIWGTLSNSDINDCSFVQNTAYHGGGVYFVGGAPEIARSDFSENEALYDSSIADPNNPIRLLGEGGAIHIFDSNPMIVDCNLFNNDAAGSGGGIYISGSSRPLLKNCLITDNLASRDGGGISANWHSDCNIVNCTIVGNGVTGSGFDTGYGGGLYCSYSSYVKVINSIIWDNYGSVGTQGSQLAIATSFKYDPRLSTLNITYSDIQDSTDPNAFGQRMDALDLVFCIDTTSSMDNDIAAVKDAANEIIDAIATQVPDFRIAVVDYKDFDQSPYGEDADYPYGTVLEFTTDANEVVDALDSLTASGGADIPESVYAAVMHCIDHSLLAEALDGELYGADPNSMGPGAWRSGEVMRVIILMADAPPHDPEPFTDYTIGDIVDAAGGIEPKHIVPVLIGQDPEAGNYFRSLAGETGGTVLQAAGAEEVVGALIDAIDLLSRVPDPIVIDANCVFNWDPNDYEWDPGSHNIDEDPCFVAGYFLSQFAAGQPFESNCVDGGSDLSSNLGLDTYTTRTDSFPDTNDPNNPDPNCVIVDMGYHYELFTVVPQYKLTFEVNGITVIEPNIYDPNYDGLYNWYTTVPLRIDSHSYDTNNTQIWWSGTDDDNITGPNNVITMDSNEVVTAWPVKTKYNLTIKVVGGNGRFFAEWLDENGDPCETEAPDVNSIKFGTIVQLRAEPDEGYRVRTWSGTDNDYSRDPDNTVTINSDKTVRVEFGEPVLVKVPEDYATIQDAVSAAENGDTIVVYPGVYYGGYQSIMLVVDKSVTIRSEDPSDPCCVAGTIIDGYRGLNEFRNIGIWFTPSASSDTVLNGLTIQNCGGRWGMEGGEDGDREENHPDGYDGVCGMGAAIYIDAGASPIIKNCVIRDNIVAGGDGGDGVEADDEYNAGRGGWAGWARGGAIYCGVYTSPTFINCEILNNEARGGDGGDGGDYSEDTGRANYGGNWSRDGAYNIDPNRVGVSPGNWVEGNLWEVWKWDRASSFWPLYGQPTRTSYIGNYRWYSGYGGGVYCDENSTVDFNNCTISGNIALGGMSGQGGVMGESGRQNEPLIPYEIPSYGGGVYCAADASVMFTGCTITDNISSPPAYVDPNNPDSGLRHRLDPYLGHGGGVCAEETATVVFIDCTFSENEASLGGGMLWDDANAELIDSNFVDNVAYKGGGVYLSSGLAEIVRNDFHGNDVNGPAGEGGGIYCSDANVMIVDCNLFHNDANSSGGGAYISDSVVWFKNCLITNNVAGRDGGGVSVNRYTDSLITNCTFVSNAAPGTFGEPNNTGFGGGLFCGYESDCEVTDSIFWDNLAIRGVEISILSGFIYFPNPSTLSITYSDIKAGQAGIYKETGCTLNYDLPPSNPRYPTNINKVPLFVTGLLGDYYLSQKSSGQSKNSPCVDTGSDLASNLDMVVNLLDVTGYTTRTDDELDRDIVDMGYHYPSVLEICGFCNLCDREPNNNPDGCIDFKDFAKFALHWLDEDCSSGNEWCAGADITGDTFVDIFDLVAFVNCWLAEDTSAPVPNPSEWEEPPHEASPTISMEAKEAVDGWGWDVEYCFERLPLGDPCSGWLTFAESEKPIWDDTDVMKGTRYGYRVKTRDELGNESEWSEIGYAGEDDTTAPQPIPEIDTIEPNSTSITMTSTISHDESGDDYVTYYFQADTNIVGADDSDDWLDFDIGETPTYTDVNLVPETTYAYRVRAKDLYDNETAWSDWVFVTTLAPPETETPTPDPMRWDDGGDPNGYPQLNFYALNQYDYWVEMRAAVATDRPDGGARVWYRFVCVSHGEYSSGGSWDQDNPEYNGGVKWRTADNVPPGVDPREYIIYLGANTDTEWYVEARDDYNNVTTKSEHWVAEHLH